VAPGPAPYADETIAAIVELAANEFRQGRFDASCTVARLVCERVPDEKEAQRILSQVTPLVAECGPPESQRPSYHLALAEAHRLLGESEAEEANYRAALSYDGNLWQAHYGLSRLRMPGDTYLVWLERLYRALAPESAIEIGVFTGDSLSLFEQPTLAIGVDPEPRVTSTLKAETHIFPETSDEFFARRRAEKLLSGRPLSVAFIDGLHLYEQALRDFIGLEALCGTRSVVLLHDTIPLDEPTQSRVMKTSFFTGDVWKLLPCLKHYRPDLDIFTIATAPSGLTVVTGLDPTSRVLADAYEEAVARFVETPFSSIEGNRDAAFNVVPNDWTIVRARLRERRII